VTRSLLGVGLLLLAPAAASAHAVGVEAKLRGTRVAVEAYFDDDTPAADATVKVTPFDGGAVVAEGKTDAKGAWSFPVPAAGKYRVTVDAGGGHIARTTITIPAAATPPATPGEAAPQVGAAEEVVSDGLTRAEATGPRRLLTAAAGLVVIAGLTWGVRSVMRRKPAGAAEGSS
jgi:hypothetical protein